MTISALFLKAVNMSITAGWLILAVIIARLVLKKAPKKINCGLWALVFVRLACPFSLKSTLSLIPERETIPGNIEMMTRPAIDSGVTVIDNAVNPVIAESFTPDPAASVNPLQVLIPVLSVIWIVGMAALLLHAFVSFVRLKRMTAASVPVKEGVIGCDDAGSPFILGILKPVIVVPSSMNGETLDLVLTHEEAHIRRRDHWWKPLGYLLLTVYWFDPLCWIAYILFCRDIEMACDEMVIGSLDDGGKAAYSQALLDCSFTRKRISACPLAFGEVGVKERVRSVLSYKKPSFWVIAAAVALCLVIAVCFLTDPFTVTDSDKILSRSMIRAVMEYNKDSHTDSSDYIATDTKVLRVSRTKNTITVYAWVMYEEYGFDGKTVSLKSGSHIPTVITFDRSADGGGRSVYDVIEYWIPRDGSYYAADIRKKFPLTLWPEAFDVSGAEKQSEKCRKAACEYFGVNDPVESAPDLSFLNYENAISTVADMTEIDTIYYPPAEKNEDGIISIGYVNGNELAKYLDLASWEKSENPQEELSSPGSIEFCIRDDYRITVYQKPALAKVTFQDRVRYYKTRGEDYDDAVSMFYTQPRDTAGTEIPEDNTAGNEKYCTYNVSYAGWSDDGTIYLRALNPEKMMISSVRHLPVYKFETKAELDGFKDSFKNILTLDQGYDEVPSFEYITAAYDDSFFSKYTLMAAYVTAGSGSYRFAVSDARRDGQSFCMYVDRLNDPEVVTDDMAGWLALVEVPKDDIAYCVEFDAVFGISSIRQPEASGETEPGETSEEKVFFNDIMGFKGYYLERRQIEGIPFYVRTYFADPGAGPDIIGESFGFEIDDHAADIDGDGATELLCNCQYEGDGHVELNVFRMNGAVPEVGNVHPEDLDLEDFHDWGINSYMSYYDAETSQMVLEYTSEKDNSKTNIRVLTADDLTFRPFTGTGMQ